MNFTKMFLMIVVLSQMTLPIFAVKTVAALQLHLYKDNLYVRYCHYERSLVRGVPLPVSAIPESYQDQLVAYMKLVYEAELIREYIQASELEKISLQCQKYNKIVIENLITILQCSSQQNGLKTEIDTFFRDTHFDQQIEELERNVWDCRVIEFNAEAWEILRQNR